MTRSLEMLTTIIVAAVSLAWEVPAEAASLGLPSQPGAPTAQSSPLNQAPSDPASLRICAAKKQPPLSLEDGSGLENKIGAALAEAMNLKPQFVWSDKPAIYLVRDFLDKSSLRRHCRSGCWRSPRRHIGSLLPHGLRFHNSRRSRSGYQVLVRSPDWKTWSHRSLVWFARRAFAQGQGPL